MAPSEPESLTPTALRKDGPDHFVIEWNDGHHSVYTWRHLRANCPCASCREEKEQPANPLRVLKPGELLAPTAVSMPRVGRYAYKIVWNDGHDTGIYTLQYLRSLCQCPQCLHVENVDHATPRSRLTEI